MEKDLPNDHINWLRAHRTRRAVARKRSYRNRSSKLNRFRAEIVQLRRSGASIREIQAWLIDMRKRSRNARSPIASVSAIHHFIRSLPELVDA